MLGILTQTPTRILWFSYVTRRAFVELFLTRIRAKIKDGITKLDFSSRLLRPAYGNTVDLYFEIFLKGSVLDFGGSLTAHRHSISPWMSFRPG